MQWRLGLKFYTFGLTIIDMITLLMLYIYISLSLVFVLCQLIYDLVKNIIY